MSVDLGTPVCPGRARVRDKEQRAAPFRCLRGLAWCSPAPNVMAFFWSIVSE